MTTSRVKRYRRACALVAFWDGQDFIFENYLSGQQTVILPLVAQLLGELDKETSKDELHRVFARIPCNEDLIESLVESGILLEENSPLEITDRLLDHVWRWRHDARYFHFSTQRIAFQAPEEERDSLSRLAHDTLPPPATKNFEGTKLSLPETFQTSSGGLWDTLRKRRTRRAFKRQPISLVSFATILQWCWGATHVNQDPILGEYLLKTSPSGGARHSIEVYPIVIRVEDVTPGIYHYSPVSHELTSLSSTVVKGAGNDFESLDDLVVDLCADQPWVRDASVVFLMTSVLERVMWKYCHSHAYRVVQLDAGHVGQTFHLVSTELGLAPFTTAALSAKRVEEVLGLDGVRETAIYGAAVGVPA